MLQSLRGVYIVLVVLLLVFCSDGRREERESE